MIGIGTPTSQRTMPRIFSSNLDHMRRWNLHRQEKFPPAFSEPQA